MISISAFIGLPEIPAIAFEHDLGIEYSGLIDSVRYPESFLRRVRQGPHADRITSAHGPFFDLIPPSRDSEVRALAMRKFRRAVEACQALGIPKLVLHSGWMPSLYPDRDWVDRSVRFWKELLASCDAGFRIYLENVFEPNPDLLQEIVESVDQPHFRICLDIGHVNVFGQAGLEDWIAELGRTIGHVHVHNNYGRVDEHNGLTQGGILVPAILEQLLRHAPDASWNMEIRTCIPESIAMIKSVHGAAGVRSAAGE
jgi:sugar phosphate isomerase/epimerase